MYDRRRDLCAYVSADAKVAAAAKNLVSLRSKQAIITLTSIPYTAHERRPC